MPTIHGNEKKMKVVRCHENNWRTGAIELKGQRVNIILCVEGGTSFSLRTTMSYKVTRSEYHRESGLEVETISAGMETVGMWLQSCRSKIVY